MSRRLQRPSEGGTPRSQVDPRAEATKLALPSRARAIGSLVLESPRSYASPRGSLPELSSGISPNSSSMTESSPRFSVSCRKSSKERRIKELPGLVPEDKPKHSFLRHKRAYTRPLDESGGDSASSRDAARTERNRTFRMAAYTASALTSFQSAASVPSTPQSDRALAAMSAMDGNQAFGSESSAHSRPRANTEPVAQDAAYHSRKSKFKSNGSSGSGTERTAEIPRSSPPNVPAATRISSTVSSTEVSSATPLFQMFLKLAKRHGLSFNEVKLKHEEYMRLDVDLSGYLSQEEFENAIRDQCNLTPGEPLPDALVNNCWGKADKNRDGLVDFEEFLQWATKHEFTEEWLVVDQKERELRQFVRDHGLSIFDVDALRNVFRGLDVDSDGYLNWDEFVTGMLKLLCARKLSDVPMSTLKRYWQELDEDQSGNISFEEFALWYLDQWGVSS